MDSKQKKSLSQKAHSLNPVVMIGQKGVTPNLLAEVDQALIAHELIKIKLPKADKSEKIEVVNGICEQLAANFVKIIGNIGIIFRKNEESAVTNL